MEHEKDRRKKRKIALPGCCADLGLPAGHRQANGFLEDYGIWREAPLLIGTTKFEPRRDVKNIMITGGAGFMYVSKGLPRRSG
jgi:hypothetical protein